ncbi:MAG: DNA repair protein RecN [Kiritimatiellae bacterium]|nr:DNA repair protein RecN [Kiritimatiellia bacterium]
MLQQLNIRNVALAESVRIDFEPGLNVITGETGAGKSILMGALSLLLGERADKSIIRTGAEQASVDALFELRDSAVADAALAELGLPACEDGQLLIRRVLRSGGGAMTVNDHPVMLQGLRLIGDGLVDMHGPHDHQALFQPFEQLRILDAFCGLEAERERFSEIHARIVGLETNRAELEQDEGNTAEQMDLMEYRAKEIRQAELKEGEEEQLREEHSRVGHAQRILELCSQIANALTESESSAFGAIAPLAHSFDELARIWPAADHWREEAVDLNQRIQSLSQSIQSEADRIEADPARLEWLDARLALYQKILRKYGGSVASALQAMEQAESRLQDLRTRGERIAAMDRELAGLRAEREKQGKALRKRREAAATELADAITGELEFLGFPGSSFAVSVEPAEPSPSGMDAVEFGFAPNVGEAMRPLRAIASSGEISRVMLAVKAVLADQDRVPVLIFDEIDANLGGEMGHAVGRELAGVAGRRQVICITHLPQVAVHGTTHWAVSKEVREGRTYSVVAKVDGAEREMEVVRMLGGSADSRATLDHAREMLAAATRRVGRGG